MEYNICQRCIITDGFLDLHINSKGLCNYCADPTHVNVNWKKTSVPEDLKHEYLKDFKNIIKALQDKYGKKKYSCVLGYSGGKDSTALLDTILHEYHLKPFIITVDTGFMTDVAKNNIRQTISKLGLENDHILLEDAIPTFTKLYRYFFLNYESKDKTLTIDLCHTCTDLIHTICVKEAIKRNIHYVFIGFSPDQVNRVFYETSKED